MEVMLHGNKVCALKVVITPDPIKIIKAQLIMIESRGDRDGEKLVL